MRKIAKIVEIVSPSPLYIAFSAGFCAQDCEDCLYFLYIVFKPTFYSPFRENS